MFTPNAPYTRAQIFQILGIPDHKGGPWFTGYTQHGDDHYLFCGVGTPGRTGLDLHNYFDGPDLIWHGKPKSRLSWPSSQALLNCPGQVHIFYRLDNRDAFTYAGAGQATQVKDGPPIEIRWVFPPTGATLAADPLPEEIPTPEGLVEGAKRTIVVNAYERNPAARARCIARWGTRCVVCNFDFAETYGPELGAGFIHVHHLKPLAEIGEAYVLNPEEDLRPVCPNCHAMLHRIQPTLSIESLSKAVTRTSSVN